MAVRPLRLGDIDRTPASLSGVDQSIPCGLREGVLWGDQMAEITQLIRFSVVIRFLPGTAQVQHIIHAENRVEVEKRADRIYPTRSCEIVRINVANISGRRKAS